jgi:hypothetical protein
MAIGSRAGFGGPPASAAILGDNQLGRLPAKQRVGGNGREIVKLLGQRGQEVPIGAKDSITAKPAGRKLPAGADLLD